MKTPIPGSPGRHRQLPLLLCTGAVLMHLTVTTGAQSAFRVDHISNFAGRVTLEFTDSRLLSDPGTGHALEYSPELTPPSWTHTYLWGTMHSSLGGDKAMISVQAPQAAGFYRIGVDSDHDGLSDRLEIEVYSTDPSLPDSDGDGYSDIIELSNGTLPGDALSRPMRGLQPGIQFTASTSRVIEGAGPILVPVEASSLYSGTLSYSVSVMSTAENGSDFIATQSGSVAVNGTTAGIPVEILDDFEVEDIEAIVLELHDDDAGTYHAGTFASHTVLLMDNDADWSGLLESDVGQAGFRLRIRRADAVVTAHLVPSPRSDATHPGGQLIPQPPPGQDGWEVTNLTFTATAFSGESEPMPAGTSRLLGPAPLARTLSFSALPPPPGSTDIFYLTESNPAFGPLVIGGHYTERLFPSQPGTGSMEFTNRGYFVLSREAPVMIPLPIPTTPAQP